MFIGGKAISQIATRDGVPSRYTPPPVSESELYFAYTALLAPERITAIAPNARFMFSAHYPATRLRFVANGAVSVPTLEEDPEHTVWGGVFAIPDEDVASITAAEESEGRIPGWEMKAIDREGTKHECLTFVAPPSEAESTSPDPAYLGQIIHGARHWKLPAGWIVGLEDLLDSEQLFL